MKRKHNGAFTLVELLVSMSVLTLLVLLVSQLVTRAADTIVTSSKHMDADTQARSIFATMAMDFAGMLRRSDTDLSNFKQPSSAGPARYGSPTFPDNLQQAGSSDNPAGNDHFSFLTNGRGYFPNGATASQKSYAAWVSYNVLYDTNAAATGPQLQRMGKGMGWDNNSSSWTNVPFLPVTLAARWANLHAPEILMFPTNSAKVDQDYKTIGAQVVRLEYNYLLKGDTTQGGRRSLIPWNTPTHTWIDGAKDVSAIVITIALIDPTSRLLVSDYRGLLGTNNGQPVFADANATDDTASKWNAQVNSGNLATTAGITPAAAKAVRVYERAFYLTP